MFCLGVNLLLAIVLFSTIVGDMLPVTNNTPLIGQIYCTTKHILYYFHKNIFIYLSIHSFEIEQLQLHLLTMILTGIF